MRTLTGKDSLAKAASLQRWLRKFFSRWSSAKDLATRNRLEDDPRFKKFLRVKRQKAWKRVHDRQLLDKSIGWSHDAEATRPSRGQGEDKITRMIRDPTLQEFRLGIPGERLDLTLDEIEPILQKECEARKDADMNRASAEAGPDPRKSAAAAAGVPQSIGGGSQRSLVPLRLRDRTGDSYAEELLHGRRNLPIHAEQGAILSAMESYQVFLVTGDTGCGKTTQLPQFILDEHIRRSRRRRENSSANSIPMLEEEGLDCSIICTQPRRVSALSVANRVAMERMESVGNVVGWKVRHDGRFSNGTRLMFCTTGVVLRMLQSDPLLKNVTHLILDEVHERSVESDLLLTLTKRLIRERKDLRVVLMSATLNTDKLVSYFNNCPSVHVPGRMYPVETIFLEDMIKEDILSQDVFLPQDNRRGRLRRNRGRGGYVQEESVESAINVLRENLVETTEMESVLGKIGELQNLERAIADVVEYIHLTYPLSRKDDDASAVLVFLAGWDQIKNVSKELQQRSRLRALDVQLLHAKLPSTSQRRVFERPQPGRRKVVLATNVAETSVTIEDIVYVVDAGLYNKKQYDAGSHLSSLGQAWIPQSSAKQRAGRAGRVQPGKCFRLYTRPRFNSFEEYPKPDLLAEPLENTLLTVLSMDVKNSCEKFLAEAPDPPPQESTKKALEVLRQIGAVDSQVERLTPLGSKLAKLPVHPQDRRSDAAQIALQKHKAAFLGGTESDHLMLSAVYNEWERVRSNMEREREWAERKGVQLFALRSIRKLRLQLKEILQQEKLLSFGQTIDPLPIRLDQNWRVIRALLCGALSYNLVRADRRAGRHGIKRGKLVTRTDYVRLHKSSVFSQIKKPFNQHWLVFHEKMKTMSGVNLYGVSAASPTALALFSKRLFLTRLVNDDVIAADQTSQNADVSSPKTSPSIEAHFLLSRWPIGLMRSGSGDSDGVSTPVLNISSSPGVIHEAQSFYKMQLHPCFRRRRSTSRMATGQRIWRRKIQCSGTIMRRMTIWMSVWT